MGAGWCLGSDVATNLGLQAIALPGYWVTTVFMEKLGRKNIQMLGFGCMFILNMILSQLMDDEVVVKKGVSGGLLIFIYGTAPST